jgi:hypothetical protein
MHQKWSSKFLYQNCRPFAQYTGHLILLNFFNLWHMVCLSFQYYDKKQSPLGSSRHEAHFILADDIPQHGNEIVGLDVPLDAGNDRHAVAAEHSHGQKGIAVFPKRLRHPVALGAVDVAAPQQPVGRAQVLVEQHRAHGLAAKAVRALVVAAVQVHQQEFELLLGLGQRLAVATAPECRPHVSTVLLVEGFDELLDIGDGTRSTATQGS